MLKTGIETHKVEQFVWVEYGKDYYDGDFQTINAESFNLATDHHYVPTSVLNALAQRAGFDYCGWSTGHSERITWEKFFSDEEGLDKTSNYGIFCKFEMVVRDDKG